MINFYKPLFIIMFSLYLNASMAACTDENFYCTCNAGYYAVNQNTSSCYCSLCPAGTYKALSGMVTSCTTCPSGTYNPSTGSTSASACQSCSTSTGFTTLLGGTPTIGSNLPRSSATNCYVTSGDYMDTTGNFNISASCPWTL